MWISKQINASDSALQVIYQDGVFQAIYDSDGMLEQRPVHRNKKDRWKSQRMTVDLVQTKYLLVPLAVAKSQQRAKNKYSAGVERGLLVFLFVTVQVDEW